MCHVMKYYPSGEQVLLTQNDDFAVSETHYHYGLLEWAFALKSIVLVNVQTSTFNSYVTSLYSLSSLVRMLH